MFKRKFEDVNVNFAVDIYTFFSTFKGHDVNTIRYNIYSLSVADTRELLESLRSIKANSTRNPVNLASVSCLIGNVFNSAAFGFQESLDDYATICGVLENLVLFQQAPEKTRFSLDPKVIVQLLIQVAKQQQPELSAYAVQVVQKLHHSKLLFKGRGEPFECHINPTSPLRALFKTTGFSINPGIRRQYLENLTYLIQAKAFIGLDRIVVLSIRDALASFSHPVPSRPVTPLFFARSPRMDEKQSPMNMNMTVPVTPHHPSSSSSMNRIPVRVMARHMPRPTPIVTEDPVVTVAVQSTPIPLSAKAAQMQRITEALTNQDEDMLKALFTDLRVPVRMTPIRDVRRTPSSSVSTHFFADAPAPLPDAPQHRTWRQGSALETDAANLVVEYIREQQSLENKSQFIELIKASDASFFNTLFSPFHTNRHLFNQCVAAGALRIVIRHLPLTELNGFLQCLHGKSSLQIKISADAVIAVLNSLNRRMKNKPVETETPHIQPLYDSLFNDAWEFHSNKGNHQVQARLRGLALTDEMTAMVNRP